jgi:hypothetical protein
MMISVTKERDEIIKNLNSIRTEFVDIESRFMDLINIVLKNNEITLQLVQKNDQGIIEEIIEGQNKAEQAFCFLEDWKHNFLGNFKKIEDNVMGLSTKYETHFTKQLEIFK